MAPSTDPVGTGLVASLAQPGGNITGLTNMAPELSGKRLELLREAVPGLSRVAILWNPDVRGAVLDYKETEVRLVRCVWRFNPSKWSAPRTSIVPSRISKNSARRR